MGQQNSTSVPVSQIDRMRAVIGPPGTGKTTHLAKMVGEAAEMFGPNSVMVASMTRAAATEIRSRDIPINPKCIGTMHSFAYRFLGAPRIAETIPELIESWNAEHVDWRIPLSRRDGPSEELASQSWEDYLLCRSQMVPWAASQRTSSRVLEKLDEAWKAIKAEHEAIDFTEMLEICVAENIQPPQKPAVVWIDEAQDLSRLEITLARQWASHATQGCVLCGDADQTIYEWRGADASLLSAIAPENRRILSQSYRVPRAVHAWSQAWIRRISPAYRIDAAYEPRPVDGLVSHHNSRLSEPESFVSSDEFEDSLKGGKSIMVLGATNRSLHPSLKMLRMVGLPFHNPFRATNGSWNPLNPKAGGMRSRLLSYLKPSVDAKLWTWLDVERWSSILLAKNAFTPGAKAQIARRAESDPQVSPRFPELMTLFAEGSDGMERALSGDLEWLRAHVRHNSSRSLDYCAKIANKRGVEALKATPQIIIGTIHSVKGGEADVVFLFPDLGRPSIQAWGNMKGRNALIRLFYVGATRARESLFLCDPSPGAAFSLSWQGFN